MLKILFLILISQIITVSSEQKCISLSNDSIIEIIDTSQEKWKLSSFPVCGYYFNEINQTGWSRLHIWTNPESTLNDSVLAYLAGYLEAYMSSQIIDYHFDNIWEKYCINETNFCSRVFQFLETNLIYVKDKVDKLQQSDSYWYQVGLILEQMAGMEDGLNKSGSKLSSRNSLNPKGKIYIINSIVDLMELENILNRTVTRAGSGQTTCSALVKLLPHELLIGHNSWIQFGYMLRVLKKYEFSFNTGYHCQSQSVPGRFISMSSYPGTIFSVDDFYLTSSGLAITETTNNNFNESSFQLVQPHGMVFTFIRTMVANRLAVDGQSWSQIFTRENSGTYNNQFMIIDYKKFSPNSLSQSPGLFWVLEQMPKTFVARDMTSVLEKNGYWSSYNIPYFNEIWNIGGYQDRVAKYGSFYLHNENPRAKLFARKHDEVTNYRDLFHLLRYNNYTQDPESRCNCTPPYSAAMSIACRGDLNDPLGQYQIPNQGIINEAAIDAKVTSYQLFKSLTMFAVSGPTYENVPPFVWSKFSLKDEIIHKGHPDAWIFKPIHF